MKPLKVVRITFYLVGWGVINNSRRLRARLEQCVEIGEFLGEKAFVKSKLDRRSILT
jgi:hypothetical protein